MNQINIPSITIDTPLPYTLNLRDRDQPLRGLNLREHFVKILRVRVWEQVNYRGEPYDYVVETVGLASQTKRKKNFHIGQRAEMVAYVNEWIAKTVAAGLKRMAEQKSEQEARDRNHKYWVAKRIEEAGGVEQRRQAIMRGAHMLAAKDAFEYENPTIFYAIFTAITHGTPVLLTNEDRERLLTRHARAMETWRIKQYIEDQMQELDAYLNEGKTEEVA